MPTPNLSPEDVQKIIPQCEEIGRSTNGGQKSVFPCIIGGKKYAIKFLLIDNKGDDYEEHSETYERCAREISALKICNSPNLITLGPIDMTETEFGGQSLIYYSEPWINGVCLIDMMKSTPDPLNESLLMQVGICISNAIEELWNHHIIHRDIKPQNIMYDEDANQFILLDLGMLYDLELSSLTKFGALPGTLGYYSPEQLDLSKKRELDFRSDLFCLGIVLYEMATKVHPFRDGAHTADDVIRKIAFYSPPAPNQLNSNISTQLSDIIMRLLRKTPSARYRQCQSLRNDFMK